MELSRRTEWIKCRKCSRLLEINISEHGSMEHRGTKDNPKIMLCYDCFRKRLKKYKTGVAPVFNGLINDWVFPDWLITPNRQIPPIGVNDE